MERFYLTILFTGAVYCVLTIPHLLAILFDWNCAYPAWLIVGVGFGSAIITPIIMKKLKV